MKLPKHAHKVFSGVIFDVYQWEQQMYDGTKETFEMLKRPDTVSIIATHAGKVMIVREIQPSWPHPQRSIIGGRVEQDEDPLVAAQRELQEETGLVSDDWELVRTDIPIRKIDWTIYTYVARNCRSVGVPQLDGGEQMETLALTFDEFLSFLLSEECDYYDLALHVARLKDAGKLDEFKELLGL